MRLAGTAKEYSSSAIAQETRIAFQSGQSWPYFKCPYQAKVMKIFEAISRKTVLIGLPSFRQAVDWAWLHRLSCSCLFAYDGWLSFMGSVLPRFRLQRFR